MRGYGCPRPFGRGSKSLRRRDHGLVFTLQAVCQVSAVLDAELESWDISVFKVWLGSAGVYGWSGSVRECSSLQPLRRGGIKDKPSLVPTYAWASTEDEGAGLRCRTADACPGRAASQSPTLLAREKNCR